MLRSSYVLSSVASRFSKNLIRGIATSNVLNENNRAKEIDSLFNLDVNEDASGHALEHDERPKTDRKYSNGINRIDLLGGVVFEPKVFTTKTGDEFVSFRVVTNIPIRRRDGTINDSTQFHDVNAFSTLARYVKNNVHKGSRVYVTGRLDYYENQDRLRSAKINSSTVVVISKSVRSDYQQSDKQNLSVAEN